MTSQVFDVIVIGCGAAGVAALRKLYDEKLQVLGLEASHKIGGRICTEKFGENLIDLGAQWCHKDKNNAVYTLIKDFDLISPVTDSTKPLFVKSNMDKLNESETDQYLKMCSLISKRAEEIKSQKTVSLCQFFRKEYDNEINSENFKGNKETAKEVLEWYFKSVQSNISSNDLLQKSLNNIKESWDDKGEQAFSWKDKGYEMLFNVLLNAYPDPSKVLPINILFNKEVMNIKWNHSPKESCKSGSLVQVQCRDGSLFTAKHAIVTVSLGVLKERYPTLFTPSIPDDKILSIRSLAMCTMNKIYMRFEKKWWPNKSMRFCIIWQEEDKAEFTDEDDWLTGLYEISTVEMQSNLLCARVVGTAAENMELCSSDYVLDGMHRMMNHFLRGYGSIPKPTEILRSTWYTNSLTRGSFSYRSVETECVDKDPEVLAKPLNTDTGIPAVCFAGEATSAHHYYTVHGAVESGLREAARLINILK